MKLKPSPFAPKSFIEMPAINGIELFVLETGLKYKNRPDVLLVGLTKTSNVAGVFTKSLMPGAPVIWCKQALAQNANGGIMVNSGNANVFTGKQGQRDVIAMANMAAKRLGCDGEQIYICSTGVIGEPLNLAPMQAAFAQNSINNANWHQAAKAICTTDTYPKAAYSSCEIAGKTVNICGIAKGSGMIAPDMATMLGFIFTDANIAQPVLQQILQNCTDTSFNAITVDSDTSTSDTVLLVATGTAENEKINDINHPDILNFQVALLALMTDLAQQVVKDGEGASKFFAVNVKGAKSDMAAKIIAMSIANSPLVKTAIAGEDANWGRIIMAIGKSGQIADRDKLKIEFGPHLVAKDGVRAATYDENVLSQYMKNDELEINVNLGLGEGEFTVWSCDFTHGYIDINADYRS